MKDNLLKVIFEIIHLNCFVSVLLLLLFNHNFYLNVPKKMFFKSIITCIIFRRQVLGLSSGIEELGSMQLHLVGCLFLGWLLVFLCLAKGVKSLGKVKQHSFCKRQ